MFDAKRLLDQFLGGQGAGNQAGTGQNQPGGQNQLGGFDLSQLGGLARNFGLGGGNGLAKGVAIAGIAGLILRNKTARNMLGGLAQAGGMAAIGALAYNAYRQWQANQAGGPNAGGSNAGAGNAPPMQLPPPDTAFNPSSPAAQESMARILLQAMIAAAKADGHIDATEQSNIFAQMDKLSLSSDDKAFLMDELRKPLDVDAIARAARSQEDAVNIYTASLLAIDIDNPAERGYLTMLAHRLNLDDKLVEQLHTTIEGATKG